VEDRVTEPKEIDVVRRAYQLWQLAAEPLGKDEEFYHQAKKELQAALDSEKDKGPSSSQLC
jgi:Protein of unknown function (DUF2934)